MKSYGETKFDDDSTPVPFEDFDYDAVEGREAENFESLKDNEIARIKREVIAEVFKFLANPDLNYREIGRRAVLINYAINKPIQRQVARQLELTDGRVSQIIATTTEIYSQLKLLENDFPECFQAFQEGHVGND